MKTKYAVFILFSAVLTLPLAAQAQSTAVTITRPLAGGYLQTVSFQPPAGPMSEAKAAQMIEMAQMELAARGVYQPTALQIAVVLLGGTLQTAYGEEEVPGLLPKAPSRQPRKNRMQVFYNGPYV